MSRHLKRFAPISLSCSLFLLLGGCGGAGNETPSGTPTEKAGADAQAGGGVGGAGTAEGQSLGPKGPAGLTTPRRAVNTKQLIDVVEEEVRGGEASAERPTPYNRLWLPPAEEKIQDEPLVVTPPKGLDPLTLNISVPAANPLTKGKFELGKQLYFDPRVSKNGTVSCATCHNPEKGWTDGIKTSVGIDGQIGGRNAPTVINTAYGRTMFWDGRSPSLEGQAQGPIQNKIEMGDQSYEEIIDRLRAISGYREQFEKVFGTDVTLDGMSKAIATFERVAALSGDSAFDKYVKDGDMNALTESEKRGMVLFGLRLDADDTFKTEVVLQKAKCTACHIGSNFTDELFHNLGIGWDDKKGEFADLGRWAISPIGSKNPAELGAFKTPTVRDIVNTAPYMHDGSLTTLEEVVEHYDKGGNPNPALDKDMVKLNLTAQEKADLVAFMKALTGEQIKVALPTLPPGPDGKSPDPAEALNTPGPKAASVLDHMPVLR